MDNELDRNIQKTKQRAKQRLDHIKLRKPQLQEAYWKMVAEEKSLQEFLKQ